MDTMRERFVRDGGVCDSRWEDIIAVCTSWSDDVQGHIAVHPTATTSTEKKATLRAMLEAGLGECLAVLIERFGDEAFIANVRSLSAATSIPVTDQTRRRAWQVWRTAGVEQWLERTTQVGRVPEDVAIALDRCVRDRTPPALSEE